MRRTFVLLVWLAAISAAVASSMDVFADDLTRMVQKDLVTLGYDPGNTDGEATTQTIVAISKFQAEHDLAVTGEVTPQLAGVVKAQIKKQGQPAGTAAAPAAPAAAQNPAALQAAQQACIRQKIEARQEAQKKKRGFGRLLSAVSRTSSQFGGGGLAGDIARTSNEIYNVNATADDLSAAAKDLGLTEEELEECRNPR
jgi:peptidoglycan hydrolase-like protein with peptidoglycan-binding domain